MTKEIKNEPCNQLYSELSSFFEASYKAKMTLDISTLLKLIPAFDTDKNDQIYRFVRSCDSAFKLATEDQKAILLVYTLNNITGSGASDVHSKQHICWTSLRTFLIDRFSNVKTIPHLNLELQSLFQRPNESITEYFHRVDLCRSKIIEKLNAEIIDDTLSGRLATTEETALSVFVNGLSSDIGTMLRTKGFTALAEAGRFAMQEDKIRAMNNARQTLFRLAVPTNNARQPLFRPTVPRHTNNSTHRTIIPRYNSNNRFTPPNQPHPQTNSNFTAQNPKICNYCKNVGHEIADCRKRAYNNNLRNNQAQKALPAPPAQVNNLNSWATNEMSNSLEIATVSCSQTPTHLLTQDIDNLQL
ncbi:uncharacterized protein LOC114351505 [Ostrinia furnacalis]|uniref:uncharacterized protein LOC114351505 n=1 Tax=Ostrinia furnacalis TaxID=93504 RepID=UPI00103E337B|nr:uncharacterized protein LOC114351505 [Ostrinia furnacalis]